MFKLSRPRYADVMSTMAFVVAMGGTAYAAATITGADVVNGSLTGKDVKSASIGKVDLAGNSVNSAKVADNTLTGADIDESTLAGVDAATVGGLSVKKINYRVPFGTAFQSVVVFPGKFRIDAQCQNSGDYLDVFAYTGEDHSAISQTAISSSNPSDVDAFVDLGGSANPDLGPTTPFAIDNALTPSYIGNLHTIQMSTPSGFVVHVELRLSSTNGAGCFMTGIAIGG